VAILLRKDIDDFLFPSQKARCFSANSACQLIIRLYKSAGLVGATSHSGRLTLLTDLSEKGVSVFVLAEHRHISTTQRYVMVNEQMLKNAINL
jgi:integrase/recombinase XerD